jgi:hAT family C-terminal dimerisation region
MQPPPRPKAAPLSKFSSLAEKFYRKKEIEEEAEGEFEAFKSLKVLAEHKDSDGLEWWRKNDKTFPTMARLARRYLAIPASSSPSERIFSKFGVVWEKRKCNFNADTANDLIYLNVVRNVKAEGV